MFDRTVGNKAALLCTGGYGRVAASTELTRPTFSVDSAGVAPLLVGGLRSVLGIPSGNRRPH